GGHEAGEQAHVAVRLVAPGAHFVGGAGLAAHGVAGDGGAGGSAALLGDGDHHLPQLAGDLGVEHLLPLGDLVDLEQGHRLDAPVVGEHRVGPGDLQGGGGDAVAEGHGDVFDG